MLLTLPVCDTAGVEEGYALPATAQVEAHLEAGVYILHRKSYSSPPPIKILIFPLLADKIFGVLLFKSSILDIFGAM